MMLHWTSGRDGFDPSEDEKAAVPVPVALFGMGHPTSGRDGFDSSINQAESSSSSLSVTPFGPPLNFREAHERGDKPVASTFMLQATSGRDGFGQSLLSNNQQSQGGGVDILSHSTATNTNTNTNTNERTVPTDVRCDQCGTTPITGIRYRCSMCADFDLCEDCVSKKETTEPFIHDGTHIFYRIYTPSFKAFPVVMNRSAAVHSGVTCSACSIHDIRGYLYHCQECSNVNLCEACESQGRHNMNHARTKLAMPSRQSQLLAESRAEIARLKEQLVAQQQQQQEEGATT